MSSLKEFLAEEAKKEQSKTADRESIRSEWIQAVDGLLQQIRAWLVAADEGKALRLDETTHTIREPALGTYQAHGLRIELGTRTIEVQPNSRYSIGSVVGDSLGTSIRHGRVDMIAPGHRVMLYRQMDPAGKLRWIFVDDQDYLPKEFNSTNFESAIRNLLE